MTPATFNSPATLALLALVLAGCAVPQRQPDWAGVARETGRIVNR